MLDLVVMVAYFCNFNGCSKQVRDGVTYLTLCEDTIQPVEKRYTFKDGDIVIIVGPCKET